MPVLLQVLIHLENSSLVHLYTAREIPELTICVMMQLNYCCRFKMLILHITKNRATIKYKASLYDGKNLATHHGVIGYTSMASGNILFTISDGGS